MAPAGEDEWDDAAFYAPPTLGMGSVISDNYMSRKRRARKPSNVRLGFHPPERAYLTKEEQDGTGE